MIFSESTPDTILFSVCVVLAICQIITYAGLIILFKSNSSLRKKSKENNRKLSMIEKELFQISRNEERETATVTVATEPEPATVTSVSEIEKKWKKKSEESPTRVPTPPPDRRSGIKHQIPVDYSKPLSRTESNSSQEMTGFLRDLSFTSSASPRDSGTGSMTIRTPQGSISYESQRMMLDSASKGEKNPKPTVKRMSRDSQSSQSLVDLSRDTIFGSSIDTLRGVEEKTFGHKKARVLSHDSMDRKRNENELHPSHASRLQTMSIEMIGMEDNGFSRRERKYEKASRLLNQMQGTFAEEPSMLKDTCYANKAYHDYDNNDASIKKSTLDSASINISKNDIQDLDADVDSFESSETQVSTSF